MSPVISVQQMREWEKATWASGQTEKEVIARIGMAAAKRAQQLTVPHDTIFILAGKGHNGDDVRAALPHFHQRKIILFDVQDAKVSLPELLSALASHKPKLIVDGLFGIGLNRALDPDWQSLIQTINDSNVAVLSIDVPSGMDADTGEVRGTSVCATVTLTVGAVKRGLLHHTAIPFVGRLDVAGDVGLSPCPFSNDLNWTGPEDFENFPPRRIIAGHKGTHGHVAIFAGSLGYHGAAALSARGALRAQPGLVTLFIPENIYIPVASQLQAAMVHPWQSASEIPDSCTAILFGPGLAARDFPDNCKRKMIELWRESSLPVAVDANALDWLPVGETFPDAIRVITPHPGEAARMLSISTAAVQEDRVGALRKLSARFGNCLVVMKGHQTLVGRREGEIFVNDSGNPFLAQGGSGDVLAGYLSGLIAQRNLQTDILKTIRYGVWQHGAAADCLSVTKPNWTIDDLLEILGLAANP